MLILPNGMYSKINENLISQQQEALRRYMERGSRRQHIAAELQTKTPLEVDTPKRVALRKALINPRDGLALERLIGKSDLFPISYLEAGLKAGKSVCRIELRDHIGRVLGHGTGFLVSPVLLLTNHHVLEDADTARFSLAQFNYETDLNSRPRQIKSFRFEPERLFITDIKLDFTLVALEASSIDGITLSEFGYLPLLAETGKALLGEYVSIIQHPSGAPKAVAIRENKITDIFDDFIHYSTDTEPGSSGSPVFNDEWLVIALHHAGVPDPDDVRKFIANEGIRISSIIKFLTVQKLLPGEKELIDNLIKSISKGSGLDVAPKSRKMLIKELNPEWYEDATGYDPNFLSDSREIPLPKLSAALEKDALPVKTGGKVLHYTHFSIVMSKSRRLALYTAVNIDGNKLLALKRAKDKWYFDSRIDSKYQCGPALYDTNDLDRGHLVRRLDPVWGELAVKANEDTFHFTNCAPQHKNFNQKTWQELEDYILNNSRNHQLKVSVFTGPVFRSDDVVYRGQFQIPAEYWKVAVMGKEDDMLSATAYLQTQKNLIHDLEFAYGQYKTYQVPITKIENITGLDFGNLRNYDPLGRTEAVVGHIIEKQEDIKI